MFNTAQFAEMTNTDTMFLPRLGLEKRVIFCVIPDNDKTYNFLITMLYTQLFDQLFRLADSEPKFDGALPVHVRFMMDEFANVALPANFKNILAVCRSRNISCDIILQSKSQIQSLYKDDWEGMIGNCDSLIYLGGNEYATFEWLSKYIGKMTERTKSQSIGKGSRGSSSDSLQTAGRELCMPDEIRRMLDDECLLLMRSEDPVIDRKYNLLKHPNVKYTPDAGGEPYVIPPDYMGDAITITMGAVATATAPEITEEMYEQLDYLEKHPEENYYENKKDDHVHRRSHHGSRNDGWMRKRYKGDHSGTHGRSIHNSGRDHKGNCGRDRKTTEAAGAELSGSISMSGSTSMEKFGNALAESFHGEIPGCDRLQSEFTGSSAGVEAALSGASDIGNSSRNLKDEEKSAGAVENIVAIDGIAVAVDPKNTVTDLTKDQLISIYTGEVKNWSDLGGENMPIVVVGREAGSGTRGAFEEILGVEDKCVYANELDSTGAVMAKVASTPGAIGYISLDAVDDSVIALKLEGAAPSAETIKSGEYFLSRPFVMATKGEISEQNELVKALFDYVYSEEGQELAASVGLITVK